MADAAAQAEAARAALRACLVAMVEREHELARLDAVAGDGDHGAGMVRGFRAAVGVEHGGSAGVVLAAAGAAFSHAAGGASGALYGSLLETMGRSLPDRAVTAPDLAQALDEGLAAVCRLGRVEPGQKTMVDTLHPFVHAFRASAADGSGIREAWHAALPAAIAGADATADMSSTRGRAARLGERSRGEPDPGAVSMRYVLVASGAALGAHA